MKKLSLEMLRLTSEEVLGRSQMKNVIGGGTYRCNCWQSVGSWTGSYATLGDAHAAGTQHCASGIAECYEIIS